MCISGFMHGCQSLQELPGNPENGRVLKAIRILLAAVGPVVLSNDRINGRSEQLENQTLMYPIGPLVGEGVEQLDNATGSMSLA
jgi:hypothetical protein